jgi:23S rRNA pseudouridine955/2504/2580 synthase
MGMPLAGDEKYSDSRSQSKWKKRGLKRLFLHAHRLTFTGPTGEPMDFHAPLPDRLKGVLDKLESD